MMKAALNILLAANLNLGRYGKIANAKVDFKIMNGFIRGGHFVYPFSYRDVARYESPLHSKRFGVRRMNRRLIETCEQFVPDILCLGHSELVEPETIATIRDRLPAGQVMMWYQDALWDTRKLGHITNRLAVIDALFFTTGGGHLKQFKTAGNSVGYLPPPVDPSVERFRGFSSADLPIDILFCGRGNRVDADERTRSIADLRERLKGIHFDINGLLGAPLVFGDDYNKKLRNARMGLNFSRRNDHYMHSSDRLWELTGNGLLTFTPRVPGMERLFSENEVVYFDGLDDLVEKVRRFHGDDGARRRVAEAGWQRAHASFDCRRVCRYMIETVMGETYSEPYEWGDQVI